jgi:Tfp pilus assembly protein PilV
MKTKTPKTQNTKGQGGFTLLETAIASVVMMVGALAVSSLFVFSTQNNIGGSERALAMAVAQQQLEQIRSVSYEDATLTAETKTFTIINGQHNYTVQREVVEEKNDDNSSKNLKRIKISVTPTLAGADWTRTPVVLVSYRSSLATGNFAVTN